MFVLSWRCIRNSLLVTSKNTLTHEQWKCCEVSNCQKKKIVICLPTEHSRNVSVRLRLNWNLKVLVFKKRVKPKYPEKNRFELSNRFNTLQLNKTVFNLVHSSVLLQFIDLCILLGCDYCDSIKGTKRFLCNSCILLGIIRPRTC